MKWTLEIPYIPPSLNIWSRLHWAARKRVKDKWCDFIWALCNENRVHPVEKVHLSATIYFPQSRRRDPDNYTATTYKIICDCLVRIGILKDDSYEYVTFTPVKFEKGGSKTVLTIEA